MSGYSFCSVAVTKYLAKSDLGEEGLILAYSFSMFDEEEKGWECLAAFIPHYCWADAGLQGSTEKPLLC